MLDNSQILAIVGNELSQSTGSYGQNFIDTNRQNALSTYLGNPDGNEVDNRSKVISTDVADAIEWIMPEIVKAFTQNNEVVTFDPVDETDIIQCELESEYVYDILMKENPGFIILHQFIKDALMQKNGFLKVYYEVKNIVTKEEYTGLTEPELMMILSEPEYELLEKTEHRDGPIPLFDVKISCTKRKGRVVVDSVPPEEFRVNSMHNSVDLSSARFTAHVMIVTASDLVQMGVPKVEVDKLPTYIGNDVEREYRFYDQGENVYGEYESSLDPSMRPIEIAECFMLIDIDEDGIAEMQKITVAGGDNPTIVISTESVSSNPFISSTAILMSHKLFGLSIYDRLKQIQEQKTTLWRNIFDNMYLQNNQRTVVIEGQANLDDLMISRPGGILRAKSQGAITPYVTPPLSGDSYKMMDYLDQVRSARSGAYPDGAVQENKIGDRVGSEGVQNLAARKEELVGLMIRVFAETGIKPLCYKIRDQLVRHQDAVKKYKFKDKWVQVNPATWSERVHSTVRVGTGSGNRKEQLGALNIVISRQMEILQMPGQVMVRENELYNSLKSFCKFSGLVSASPYFLDPDSEIGQQHKQMIDDQSNKASEEAKRNETVMIDAQAKIAQAEMEKAAVAAENVRLKGMLDGTKNELTFMKQNSDALNAQLKQKLEEAKTALDANKDDAELEFKYWAAKLQSDTQMKIAARNDKGESDES